MKRSKVIYLLSLILSLTVMGCSKAGMGSKGGKTPTVVHRTAEEGPTEAPEFAEAETADDVATNEAVIKDEDTLKPIVVINGERKTTPARGQRNDSIERLPVLIVEEKASVATQAPAASTSEVLAPVTTQASKKQGIVINFDPVTQTASTQVVTATPAQAPATEALEEVRSPKYQKVINKQSSAVTPTVVAPEKVATKKKQILPAILIYGDQTERTESKEDQEFIALLFSRADIQNARKAAAVPAAEYEANLTLKPGDYISSAILDVTIPSADLKKEARFYPCDLNVIGPCVVVEKDSSGGSELMRVYAIGTATKLGALNELVLVRKNISDRPGMNLKSKVVNFFKSRRDGLYVYSWASNREETVALERSLISAENAKKMIAADNRQKESGGGQIQVVTNPAEKEKLSREIEEAVAKYTTKKDRSNTEKNGMYNKCKVISAQTEELPTHGLKTVRRIFIADVVNVAGMIQGRDELPLKIGKGILTCKLTNGDVQKINILIKEFISPFTVGLALFTGKQSFISAGIGYANGARDILEIKDYGFILEGEGTQVLLASALGASTGGLVAAAFLSHVVVTPIILSGSKDHKPILAGAVASSFRLGAPAVRVTLGGRYEITIDPDDT